MKIILYSAFLFLLAPCNAPKNAAAKETNPVAASDNLKTVLITYSKTFCFGTCPVFTLTINGEKNKMIYKGERNVEKIGSYEKNISDEELTKLVNAFNKNNFFELKDAYTSAKTDIPSKFVTYSINGKTKKVEDQQDAPAALTGLEKLLDDIADSSGWEKVKDSE